MLFGLYITHIFQNIQFLKEKFYKSYFAESKNTIQRENRNIFYFKFLWKNTEITIKF